MIVKSEETIKAAITTLENEIRQLAIGQDLNDESTILEDFSFVSGLVEALRWVTGELLIQEDRSLMFKWLNKRTGIVGYALPDPRRK